MNENLRPVALGWAAFLQVAPSVFGPELVLGGSTETKPQMPLGVRPLPLAKTPQEAWAVALGAVPVALLSLLTSSEVSGSWTPLVGREPW